MPKQKRKILKDFELTEISGVDNPAQPTALMTIMKSKASAKEHPILTLAKHYCTKNIDNAKTFVGALIETKVSNELWPMTDALTTSIRSILASDMADAEKPAAISASITQFSARIMSEIEDVTNPLKKCITELLTKTEDDPMPAPEITVEELSKQVATLTKKLSDAEVLAKLSDGEKKFMDGMSDDASKAFKGLSSDERKAKMNLAKSEDETIIVAGETVSKNVVGASMFAVIKSQQTDIAMQKVEIAKAKEKAEVAEFTKRATADFSHIPGKADEIAAVLKAVAGSSEAVIKTVDEIFKSAEEMALKAFGKQGHGNGSTALAGTAIEKLETLAKAHATEHNVDYNTAYSTVIEKNEDLYTQTLNEAQ